MVEVSRTPQVDVEKCTESVGNRFDMIVLATNHSRNIRKLNKTSSQYKHQHTVITSLLDIQEGKITE